MTEIFFRFGFEYCNLFVIWNLRFGISPFMFKDKKIIVGLLVVATLLGGFLGSVFSPSKTNANFLEDIYGFITGATLQNATGTAKIAAPLYKPTFDYESAVVQAVKNASPAVVSIIISKDLPVVEKCPYNPFGNLPPEFQQLFGNGGPKLYTECDSGETKKQEVGGGSGFIITSDGLIVTNKHVISDISASYTVLTNDGKKYDATIVARDPVNDLALLRVQATGLPMAKLGDSDSLELGQTSIAIGNSLGEFRNTVSVGVVSGLARNVTASDQGIGAERIRGVIQTDAAINPGNSGGPLLNLKGEVIGINTAIVSGAQNIGFAIPINQAKRAIRSVQQTGEIKTLFLGVRYIMLSADFAKNQNLPVDHGALLRGTDTGSAIIKDSPADKAGLKAEDIVLEVGGKSVEGDITLGELIQNHNIGDTVTLTVRRGNETIPISVTLEERPKNL